MTYSFLELLIFFWYFNSRYLVYEASEAVVQRSSRQGVFCAKGVLKNFGKFTGKHLCQSLFFNKVADLRLAALLKRRLWHRCFPVDFANFLRTSISTEHLQCLLLKFISNHTKEMLYMNTILRILKGKKHRQMKLQRLQKVQIWAFGWYNKSTLYKRFFNWNKNFKR